MIDVRELRIGNYVYLGSPDIYWGGTHKQPEATCR